jgi:WD40 repeat protein
MTLSTHELDVEVIDPSLERTFRGHAGPINAVDFNPNMKQMVSCGDDGQIMVWNFKPTLRAFKYAGHKVLLIFDYFLVNAIYAV